jgi:hypothetical protein
LDYNPLFIYDRLFTIIYGILSIIYEVDFKVWCDKIYLKTIGRGYDLYMALYDLHFAAVIGTP